ncbi:zinc-dependent metalloprotease [Pelagicoccus sp. SDUM812002]|uniref:zinc-dependent metalloprotease n=1 Tax=Pelagicoccus sp. SDUM812002 TaxID=3041266 RepID=UPI00280C6F5D|nr:zinc-dependent metalloprotease [Pelagicoccus sp. SDUM812002]MDQ8187511.1 zinc-dependent metalloprotease [Pelagicoccus sp. SDUM812002]
MSESLRNWIRDWKECLVSSKALPADLVDFERELSEAAARMALMKILRAFLFSAIVLFFLACTAQSAKEKAGPPLKVAEKTRVAIPHSALGNEYIFSTSLIPQSVAATSKGMLGRVVFFELFEDGLDMYETTKGQVVTTDLPARRLLATFPVIEDSGRDIVIDFNAGMRRLAYGNWYSMDTRYDARQFERSAELPQARVFEVVAEGDTLSIRQAVQARSRVNDPDLETRYEIRYFLQPYETSDFEPIEMNAEENRYLRFFESAGLLELESGRISRKISRFDISEPIVFYYSANTPENLQEAVEEGILYWNKAFGKDVLEARIAPEGVTAPDSSRNIIQWVPWDLAGFAYADALVDPLTGEMLRGQAYVTSAFDFRGKDRARRLLRSLRSLIDEAEEDEDDDSEEELHALQLGHAGCRVDPIAFAKKMAEGLEEVLSDPDVTDEAIDRIAKAYVRNVTAHEVGHVLGLRHNFAASMDATVSPKELDTFVQDFVAGNDLSKYEDKRTSTSVMEYPIFKASIFDGWKILQSAEALDHDAAAIRFAYLDDDSIKDAKLSFGSEEETNRYADVLRRDFGLNPIEANYRELSVAARSLPNAVIERFISDRAPVDPRDRKSLEAVELNASGFARRFSEPVKRMLGWFDKNTRSLVVEREFEYVGDINEAERYEAHWKRLESSLDELGGVDQVIFAHLPAKISLKSKDGLERLEKAPKLEATNLIDSLKELLDTDAYSTFVGLDGETYTWTVEEKEIIVERSSALFEKLEEEILLQTLSLFENATRDLGLAATGNLSDEDNIAILEKRIIALAKHIILKRDKDSRIEGKVDKAYVEVPDFEYKYETRMAAAKALNDKTGSFEYWSKEAKQSLHADLKSAVEGSLNIDLFKNFDDKILSRSLREWYLQQQNLLKMLPPAPKQ